MSQEELTKARPGVMGFDAQPGAEGIRANPRALPAAAKPPGAPGETFEMRRERDRDSVSWYYFRAGKLGAVRETAKLATKLDIVPIEQTQAAVSKLTGELKANFALKAQEQIVLNAGVDGAALLTAQLWEDKANGLHLYFAATNQHIEILVFDPTVYSKKDFYSAPEALEKLKMMQSVRRQLGDRVDPPMPLIDLLATPATEKK